MLPTFIGLGAQRAGTTWAYNCLAEHPEVFMTKKKELHFFYVNYGRGLEWYESQFEGGGAARARGEITPDYMYHEAALSNIARDVPAARAFVILRNPVERAASAYALHSDRYRGMSFREAVERHPELLDRGMYARHLAVVRRYIPDDRLKILFYDDLKSDPQAFLDQLFAFVGVTPGFRPSSLGTRYNRVIYPGLQKWLLGSGLGWSIDLVKRTRIGAAIRARHAGARTDETGLNRRELGAIARQFADDVSQLSALTGRDLSHWLS
jgi:hypothetical protein